VKKPLPKILIIDGSPSDRRIYRRFLEGRPGSEPRFDVIEAGNAKAGLEACIRRGADCIILDFRLPDKTGLELIGDLRKSCAAPILFLTAEPLPLTQTQAYRLGAVRYISKDFVSSETLVSAVTEAMEKG
jgi:CheY-like chemotaxis protein